MTDLPHQRTPPINTNSPRRRASLERTRDAIQRGTLRIGFVGGSITEAGVRHNWPEPVAAWLKERFPAVRIILENAAIGATGSNLGVFTVDAHIVARECDLVFVDYSVNDSDEDTDRRRRAREGLIRKLLADGERDVVVVHTFRPEFLAEMERDTVPTSCAELDVLAEHYGLHTVNMGAHALEEVKLGRMRWEEWLPDSLHPTSRGSLSYAAAVIHLLEGELDPYEGGDSRSKVLPEPLDANHWAAAYQLDVTDVRTTGPWILRRNVHSRWFDYVLETAAVGARISIPFRGRALTLGFDFGTSSGEIRYRVDGGHWAVALHDRPDWTPETGWIRMLPIVDDDEPSKHEVELEVRGPGAVGRTGSNCRLVVVGVVP